MLIETGDSQMDGTMILEALLGSLINMAFKAVTAGVVDIGSKIGQGIGAVVSAAYLVEGDQQTAYDINQFFEHIEISEKSEIIGKWMSECIFDVDIKNIANAEMFNQSMPNMDDFNELLVRLGYQQE